MEASWIFTALLLFTAANATVLRHPESLRVSVGEWSNFTCTIDCSQHRSLRWRFAVPTTGLLNGPYIRSGYFKRFGTRNGITVEAVSKQENSHGGEITEIIRILATTKLNGTVIQCAAIGRRGSQDYFSKFALLQIEETSASQNSSKLDLNTQ